MKYIDAEKLIAEIAKLRKEHTTREYRDEAALVLEDLEDYISSLQQEQPSLPDLDEAAEEYMKKARKHLFDDSPIGRADDAFKAGAEWQMKQMLKDAAEGEIQMRYSGCLCAKTIRAINEDKFKLGDKVRIIIVKEGK